jgi:hypothetical protein
MAPLRMAMRADVAPTSTQPLTSTITVYVQEDTIIPTPSPAPANQGMSVATKVGLGMIPIVVFLVGTYILFLFWFRKRRAAQKARRVSTSPPPVPEKDVKSCNSSIASRRGSSKVLQMAAFSAPLQNGRHRERQFLNPGAAQMEPVQNGKSGKIGTTMILSPKKDPHVVEADLDSPIDGSSPFRLKRGDTVKRNSLGPELARLWPSPPASAWINPSSTHGRSTPVDANRKSLVYHDRTARYQR